MEFVKLPLWSAKLTAKGWSSHSILEFTGHLLTLSLPGVVPSPVESGICKTPVVVGKTHSEGMVVTFDIGVHGAFAHVVTSGGGAFAIFFRSPGAGH